MWRVLLYLGLLAIAATGAIWLADTPETIAFTWRGREYTIGLAVGVVVLIGLAIAVSLVLGLVRMLVAAPGRLADRSRRRAVEKGRQALSRGLVAVGSGDAATARRLASEAGKALGPEPLALLLTAQAAQLSGDRDGAEAAFRRMVDTPATRVLGHRGLFVEAKRRGDLDTARQHAEAASTLSPAAGWASDAVLDARAAAGDWRGAVAIVERRASLGLVDRAESRRQRAVLHAADALSREDADPHGALAAAQEAVRLAPDLVPAAAFVGRALAAKGDLKGAAKVIETAWRAEPHPDLAAAYLNLRSGDSAIDRLGRAETLARLSSWAPEARLAIARAALDARQPDKARDALAPLLAERPTVRACLTAAEIEKSRDNGGGVREWLARAARAPRDAAWIADGIVSDRWAPMSPVTGRLDAFRWGVPPDVLGPPVDPAIFAPSDPPPGPLAIDAPAVILAPDPSPDPTPPTATPVEAGPSPEPVVVSQPVDPASPGREVGSRAPAGAPVVFPVRHAPDDPGPDGAVESPLRRRFGGN